MQNLSFLKKFTFFLAVLGFFVFNGLFLSPSVAKAQNIPGANSFVTCTGNPPASPTRITFVWPAYAGYNRFILDRNGTSLGILNYVYSFDDNFAFSYGASYTHTATYTNQSNNFGGEWSEATTVAICDASINVSTSGASTSGSWTITSSPAGETKSATSNTVRPPSTGANYTITVTPPSGYNISSITNSKGGSTTSNSLSVSVFPGDSVSFNIDYAPPASPPRTLNIQKNGTGTGNVTSNPAGINCINGGTDCTEQYADGTPVTLTASATSGTFAGWSGGGCSGTNLTCTVTMDADKTVTATFNAAITADIQGSNNGSTYSNGPIYLASGQSLWYQWTSSGAGSCFILAPVNASVATSGTAGPISSGNAQYPSASGTTYTIQCPSGGTTDSFFAQAVPGAPTGVTTTSAACGTTPPGITVNWSATSGATSYKILRSTVFNGTYTQIASGVTGTSYYDNVGLTAGNWYYYKVRAVNAAGDSADSLYAGTGAPSSCAVPTPDLTAAAPSPSAATAGSVQSFSSSISNIGSATTGASFSNFFQVASAANGGGSITDKASSSMATLGAGSSSNASTTHTFATAGTYSVRACADATSSSGGGVINEGSNEGNNCSAWTNVTVGSAGAVPTVASPTVSAINATGATLGANVTSAGSPATLTDRGTCWGTTANPISNCGSQGTFTTGVFTHARTGMAVNNTYFYRGYADNATGRGYSADGTFNTNRDLTAGSATPTTATAGTSLTFSSLLSNTGSVDTGATFSNFFQVASATNGGGTLSNLTSASTATLAGGATRTITSPSYTFTNGQCTSGTCSVRMCADMTAPSTGSVIAEVNEANNCGTWANVTVTNTSLTVTPSAGANGTITPNTAQTVAFNGTTNFTVAPSAGYTASVGGTCGGAPASGSTSFTYTTSPVTANCTVVASFTQMSGTLTPTTSSCTIPLNGSSCTSGTLTWTTTNPIGTSSVTNNGTATLATGGPLSANNGSATFTVPYNNSMGGVTTFYVYNNSLLLAQATVTTTCASGSWNGTMCAAAAQPDLTAGTASPTSYVPSVAQTYSATITNSGSATTGASFSYFWQTATGTGGSGTVSNSASSTMSTLAAGANGTATSPSVTFSGSGVRSVRVCADLTAPATGGVITESNEANNCGAWTDISQSAGQPDLTILPANDPTPTSANTGSSTTFNSVISNTGSASSGSSFTNIFQFDNDANHATVTGFRLPTAGPIAASATAPVSTTYTFATAGTWYVRACADNNSSMVGTITESDEADNCSNWVTVTVSAPASPVIASFTATPASTTNPGDPSTLDWSSSNTDYCTSDFFAGNGASSGSQVVNPMVTTTYNLTCFNIALSQQVSAQATVTVGTGAQKKPKFYED